MTTGPKSDWTEDRIDIMRAMLLRGCSASMVGEVLGVTRNAVIGKAGRLGLTYGAKPKPQDRAHVAKTRAAKPKAVAVPKPRGDQRYQGPLRASGSQKRLRAVRAGIAAAAVYAPSAREEGASVALLDLKRHHCRWPLGEADDGYCGRPISRASYCGEHYARSYYAPAPRKRVA